MEAGDRTIDKWMAAIESGRLQLPRFQRFEAWGPGQVGDLLKTVCDGLPAGAALVLQVGDIPPFKCRPLDDASDGPDRINELLLDGQQRLTALWRGLNDRYENVAFFVGIKRDQNGIRGYAVTPQARYKKNGKPYPLWCDDPTQVLTRGLLPVRLLLPGNRGEQAARDWIKQATPNDLAKEAELTWLVSTLRTRVATFNLPFLFLPLDTEKPVVLDVFIKMNTRSVQLTAFDIIVAEVEGELGQSLHDLVQSLRGDVPEIERYLDPADLVLNVASLLQERAPNQAGYFGVDWGLAIQTWPKLVEGCRKTVELLDQERVLDDARLPSIVPVPVLVALWAQATEQPDGQGNARLLLRRYMWQSFFSNRYEFSAATAALQDYRALLPAIKTGAKTAEAPVFAEQLPSASELLVAGWPKKRDRLGRALLLLSFQGGAIDLADETPITALNVSKREYHHLFPVAYLRRQSIPHSSADLALNCALITWKTNRTISDSDPVDYIKQRANQAALGNEALRARLNSHGIPFEPLASADYETFLTKRAEVLEVGLQQVCRGLRWSPI
jgi:hypothetical protein